MALRLVLAEYNLLVREGLEQLLDGVDGVEVVGTCVELDVSKRVKAALLFLSDTSPRD